MIATVNTLCDALKPYLNSGLSCPHILSPENKLVLRG